MARSGYRPGAPDAPEDGSGGPLRSPPTEGTSSDTLVLDSAGGFEIQVDSLECGGGAVELWVLTPVEEQLTDNACFTTDSLWTFPGPYDAETGVVLHVVPNFGNPPAQGAFQISGSFPTWTVDIEAGFDDDFNDVNLTVSWLEPQDTLVLSMTADTTELHPWIGQTSVNGRPQALRPGDTVQISVDGTVPGVDVEVSVELFPGGGHAHLTSRVPLTSVVLATNSSQIVFGDLVGKPWAGFLAPGDTSALQLTSDSQGDVAFSFVAGTVSGSLDVIVTATAGGVTAADTISVDIKVPALIDPEATDAVTAVYWIGGTTSHPQGSNWYIQPWVADKMQTIVDFINLTSPNRYVQYNDASLVGGGTFTVFPGASGIEENPIDGDGHVSHALGVDIDIGLCYATTSGEDNQINRVSPPCADSINGELLLELANGTDAYPRLHGSGGGNHYHIRFEEGT